MFVLCILKAVKKLGHHFLRDAMVWPTNFATYESFWLHNPILRFPINNWNTAGIYRLWKFSNGKWVPMLGGELLGPVVGDYQISGTTE